MRSWVRCVAAVLLLVCPLPAEDTKVKKADFPPADKLPVVAELPDPFLRPDGSRVMTKDEWNSQRKELLARILHYEYGSLPPVAKNVAATERSSKKIDDTGATERELLLTMGPADAVQT